MGIGFNSTRVREGLWSADDGWIVIIETAPGSRVALADSSEGFLKPVEDKGALIAIETEELEAWYEKLEEIEGIEFIFGWEEGDYVQQFRVYDPGGYVVEFVRWHEKTKEKFKDLWRKPSTELNSCAVRHSFELSVILGKC